MKPISLTVNEVIDLAEMCGLEVVESSGEFDEDTPHVTIQDISHLKNGYRYAAHYTEYSDFGVQRLGTIRRLT